MRRADIGLAVDRHGFYTQLLTRANNTERYLAPVGDQDLLEHWELEGNVTVLLRWILVALGLESLEGVDERGSGIAGIDDVVDVAAAGSDVGMRKLLAILLDL